MDDRVAAALDDAFPDRVVDVAETMGPSWNERNRTVRVEFGDGTAAFLKVALDGDPSRVRRERAVLAYVAANTAVPVPTVLAAAADAAPPYLATAPMAGETLLGPWMDADEAERASLTRRVGRALARVHDLRFDVHGTIADGDARSLDLDTGPWPDVLVDRIEWKRSISPCDRFDHHFDRVVDAVERNRRVLDVAPAALLHGDPAKPNVFVDDAAGFVDWEVAHVGDPARDLRRAHRQMLDALRTDAPDALVDALYDGYRSEAGGLPTGFADRAPVYDAVAFLGVSGFFEHYADFIDEPEADLAAWVRDELDRRLATL